MALLVPDVGETELLGKLLYGRGGAISSSTNAAPIVVTTAAAHGLSVNDRVTITDHLTNTNANGTWVLSAVGTTTFTLTATTGNGVGGATGFWCLADVESATLKLYQSNTTVAETDVAATYTEANFTNYTSKALNGKLSSSAGWTLPASVAPTGAWSAESLVAEATQPSQSWTCGTTGNTIYGYFVVGATSNILWWAERFATARTLASADSLTLVPRLGLS
jgi:hypothetical protein